ncbi:MAG: zf-HC2 domain-containing protein [Deltaproteobacteria bacterium]|nr:zf-HC2 domain-containing protein [Deltaproteobacteria bacterium]
MKTNCETVNNSLGAWLDGELGHADAEEIRRHVEGCPSCSGERRRLERVQVVLSGVLETEASRVAFEPFWDGVRRRISEERPRQARLWEWARPAFYPQRIAWAVPVAIVFLLAIFSLVQYAPGWRWGVNRGNVAAVDSIDGHGFNVAVLRESKTKTTVIWLFESQEEDDEASGEPTAKDPAF